MKTDPDPGPYCVWTKPGVSERRHWAEIIALAFPSGCFWEGVKDTEIRSNIPPHTCAYWFTLVLRSAGFTPCRTRAPSSLLWRLQLDPSRTSAGPACERPLAGPGREFPEAVWDPHLFASPWHLRPSCCATGGSREPGLPWLHGFARRWGHRRPGCCCDFDSTLASNQSMEL